jgi:2-methylcitrate dehydratase PrpD
MTLSLAYDGPRQPSSNPEGPTGLLCDWLADLTLTDIPANVQDRAKVLMLDGIGCAIVGAQLPWSKTAVDIVRRVEGDGDNAIIGWGAGTSTPGAALLNGTFIQGFELDDFHPFGPLHSASVVLPAALACSERLGNITGSRFLLASIAGFEVGPRVGMALHGAQMLSRGWHSGSVFGTHAAAAAAGVLLHLDPARFEDALGLAATQSAGLMAAQYEAMSKRMHHGFSARNGLYAALLAAGGYTGIKRVFEREYGGFLSVFGEGHDPDVSQIASTLGEVWETPRIAIKRYAAMGALHGPLDGLFDVASKRPLKPDEIDHIDIDMTHSSYHHGWWVLERPITPIGAQMNVGYAIAAAILDGEAMVQQFSPTRIDRDDVWALIPRITARHDPSLDNAATRGSRVTIHFTDGTSMTSFNEAPRTVADPLDTEGVIAKFRTITHGIIADDRRQAIIDTVLTIEELPDLGPLIDLIAPAVGSPF